MTEKDLSNWNEAEKLQMDQLARTGLAVATTVLAVFAAYKAWESGFETENLSGFGILLGLTGTTWRMVGNTTRDLGRLEQKIKHTNEPVSGPRIIK